MQESGRLNVLAGLIHEDKAPGTHLVRGWVCPTPGPDPVAKKENPYPFRNFNVGPPAHSLVTVLSLQ
jgi:hypothetical protein